MFCCCSLNSKDEAIQVKERETDRHSLGSTLIRPVNPRIIKPSMQSFVSNKYLRSKVSLFKSIFIDAKILISSYKISIFAFMKIVLKGRYSEMITPKIYFCADSDEPFQVKESRI